MTHSTKNIPPILLSLKRLLEHRGKYIILGDFNLYHLLWNSPLYDKHHYLADELLNIIGDIGVILYTVAGRYGTSVQRYWARAMELERLDRLLFLGEELLSFLRQARR